jgi:hypothetical protein
MEKAKLKVLGIDPGPEDSAFVLWDGELILTAQMVRPAVGIQWVNTALVSGNPVAIEALRCYGRAIGRETLETAYTIGRLDHEMRCRLVPFSDYSRYWCNSTHARPAELYGALRERFGEPGTKAKPGVLYPVSKNEHLRCAFALAVYVHDVMQLEKELDKE